MKDTQFGESHYVAGMPDGIETFTLWETQGWGEDAYKATILKYVLRMDHKNQKLSDARKVVDYARALVLLLERDEKAKLEEKVAPVLTWRQRVVRLVHRKKPL